MALPLDGVPTVHLGIVEPVRDAYRALHLLPSTPPPDVSFYSGAWADRYEPTCERAADSIVDNALRGFDFPKLIERAWADGVRLFVEAGPQGSCTRMIGRILGDRPHLAVSACVKEQDGYRALLSAVAKVAEAGVPIDLEPLVRRGRGLRRAAARGDQDDEGDRGWREAEGSAGAERTRRAQRQRLQPRSARAKSRARGTPDPIDATGPRLRSD